MYEQNKESTAFDDPTQQTLRQTAYDSAIQRWTVQDREWQLSFLNWKEPIQPIDPGVFCEITILRKRKSTDVLLSVVVDDYANRSVDGRDKFNTYTFLLSEHLLNIDTHGY